MSGELDPRPDLVEQLRVLRDKVRDLESRVSGDEAGLDLSDLNDVRVDSMVDGGVTLVDGSTLLYRASNKIWVAGTGTGGSFPITYDDGTYTYRITAGSTNALKIEQFANADEGGTIQQVWLDPFEILLDAKGDLNTGSSGDTNISSEANITIGANGGDLGLNATAGDIKIEATGNTFINALPTSDPGISGALYTVAGVLHVSP